MKALTIRQPWANLIATGQKRIELRTWSTDYRGELLIIAGKQAWVGETSYPIGGPFGATVCIVTLADVRDVVPRDELGACVSVQGFRFAWVLRHPRATAHVPATGRLKLFDPAPITLARLREGL